MFEFIGVVVVILAVIAAVGYGMLWLYAKYMGMP